MGRTGRIEHFRHRQDWDASLFWRLNNMGFGNLAEIREQRVSLTAPTWPPWQRPTAL